MSDKKWTAEEIAEVLGVEFQPPLNADEVKRLYKSLPGYQAIADDCCEAIHKHGETLALDGKLAETLEDSLAKVKKLEPLEKALEKLYQSVYHQRMKVTSDCMDGLYQFTRRVREFSNAYPEVTEDVQPILDFMQTFRPGPKKKPAQKES